MRRPQFFTKSLPYFWLHACSAVKRKGKILKNFVAISEYVNFKGRKGFAYFFLFPVPLHIFAIWQIVVFFLDPNYNWFAKRNVKLFWQGPVTYISRYLCWFHHANESKLIMYLDRGFLEHWNRKKVFVTFHTYLMSGLNFFFTVPSVWCTWAGRINLKILTI